MNKHSFRGWDGVGIHTFNIGGEYKGWALRLGGLKIEIIWMKHKWNFKLELSNKVDW